MRSAVALVFGLGLGLILSVLPRPAIAGVYEVRSCGTSSDWGAFVASSPVPAGLATSVQCPAIPGRRQSGLVLSSTTGNTLTGTGAVWTITAPPGNSLIRLGVQRAFQKWDNDWNVFVRAADETVIETCELVGAQVACGRGLDSGTQTATYSGLRTSSVSFGISCAASHECAGAFSPVQAWVAIYSSVALVDDPAPPTVAPLTGATLSPGWHSGAERVEVSAQDVSGIKSVSVYAGDTKVLEKQETCDYSRMQPCPASEVTSFVVDTANVPDGTQVLKVMASDAADQLGMATGVMRVDRHAPGKPGNVLAAVNADGTLGLSWTNPDQGSAAPIVGAQYRVCDAAGVSCGASVTVGRRDVARVDAVPVPAGDHLIKLWLQDEAGHADEGSAATLVVDPRSLTAPRVLETNPPVLDPGPAPSPSLKIAKAQRNGATLTLSGTIAKAAKATITAKVSKQSKTATLASARAKPKQGKWTLKVRLTKSLRRASAFYVTVGYPGESAFAKSTVRRRLTKKTPRAGRTTEEFSLEARSAR